MFALSTSWNAHRHNNARSMVEEIKKIGVDHIELNFTLTKDIVSGIIGLVDKGVIKVVSLHNFCPVPDSVDVKKASPDYFSLAAPNEEERKNAVEETKRTIDTAARLSAEAVVIHAGRLDISDKTRDLAKAIEGGIDATAIADAMKREREGELKKGYLDSLLKSIGEISAHSKERGIKVALENRFYFKELPSIEEFEVIFADFPPGANIYYWHDTGHAQVFDNLGLAPHKEYLDKFSSRLAGVHLHDVKGIINDHRAPLTGDFDFAVLKPYINKSVLKVLEPHAPATSEEIERALEHLKKLYGEER